MDFQNVTGFWNDPLFPKQWHLHNMEFPSHDINVLPVWNKGIFGNGVTVALLDFGIDYTHEDLMDQYVRTRFLFIISYTCLEQRRFI